MPATMTAEKRLYLVDAHAYLHRAYHALPPLTNKKGMPVGALFGFARMLLGLVKKQNPDYIAVCFDTPGPTFRHEAYVEYKATRDEIDEDLIKQLEMAEEMVRTMGLPAVAAPGFEADDLLATLSKKGIKQGMSVVLVTGDKDALQLVGDRIQVWNEAKGVMLDPGGVEGKLSVKPEQVVDYLAIVGDSSDNVPGVPGIGAKGAAKLLNKFGSLKNLLKAAHRGNKDLSARQIQSLVDNEEQALKSRELIALHEKVPVKVKPSDCVAKIEPSGSLTELFSRLEFFSLLREIGGAGPAPKASAAAKSAPFKEADLKTVLKDAKKAKAVQIAVGLPAQRDLLHDGAPMIAFGLPDGRAAVAADESLAKHRKEVAGILAASGLKKIGHDIKEIRRLLREADLVLDGGIDDTMLATYCLDPSRGKYGFDKVYESVFGEALPKEEAARALARQAAVLGALRDRYLKDLKDQDLEGLYRNVELPFLEVLNAMEESGIAVDGSYLKKLRKDFDKKIERIKGEIDKLAGVEINLKSTKQLAELFYDRLGLPVVHKTKKGGRSTDEEALRVLAEKHPIPSKIIDYREITKLQSTYVVALLEKIDAKTGRVHSHFNQAGTATGRLSSVAPNLQNIPIRTALGRKIRRAFVAKRGHVLVAADYSQIDLRVLAHLSGDETLCDGFRNGADIHLRTAGEVFGIAPEKVDKEMRRRAKAVNFGIVYGQSGHGLAQELGISRPEAQSYIKKYFERYPQVSAWIADTREAAKRDRAVKTLSGRIRPLPDIVAKNFQVRSFNERVAINTPIQGTSADIIRAAMLDIHKQMASQNPWKARLVLQVHDELVFEVPKREAARFSSWARERMEGAMELSVPLVVDVKAGENWDEMEALRP